MVPSTNAQLGKLLAAYLSTSNDTLAVSFRAHYATDGSQTAPACSPTFSPALHTRRKPASLRLTSATFSYRWFESEQRRITRLYQCLLNAKWIAADTKPDDFLAIFSGEESTARVKWLGKPAYLYYLIRRAAESQLISFPNGGKIWQITESHFTDSNSRPLHDLRKQKEPKTAIQTIETMLRILEPSA